MLEVPIFCHWFTTLGSNEGDCEVKILVCRWVLVICGTCIKKCIPQLQILRREFTILVCNIDECKVLNNVTRRNDSSNLPHVHPRFTYTSHDFILWNFCKSKHIFRNQSMHYAMRWDGVCMVLHVYVTCMLVTWLYICCVMWCECCATWHNLYNMCDKYMFYVTCHGPNVGQHYVYIHLCNIGTWVA